MPYEERLSSRRTTLFFLALTALFALLFLWRLRAGNWGWLPAVLLLFAVMFFFYVLNYRALVIRLTPKALKLRFGVFSWTVALDNVEDAALDELPAMMEYGGAGIHFMMIRGRYRVSFNFLEYPRVVLALKRPKGPVRDVSFSTRQPERLLELIRGAAMSAPPGGSS